MGGAPGPKRTSSGGELKSPTSSSTGGGARGGSNLARPGGTTTDKTGVKKSTPNSTRRQVTSGKPPSGAQTTTNGSRSGLKQQPSGTTGRRTPTKERAGLSNGREKAGGLSDAATEKGGVAESQGERARKSSGGSTTGKKTMVSSVKKSGGTGGRDSPARDRKTSVEKKPVAMSADSSPATLRRAGSVRRPGGTSSSSPGVVRRSSTLRRTGSSGSIPVGQRPVRERKADSESQKIERKVGNDKKTESVSPKPTGAKGEVKVGVKTGKTASPGAVRRSATESGRRGTGERRGGGPTRAGKQVPSATGIYPTGRRSVRSRSEVNIGGGSKKNDTQSLGRKISATSAIGRGSPSPSTLAGKAIILDHTGLQDEERLRSTLKLFGAKSGAPGAKKTNRGQVIKSMGVATTSSGRSTPTWKNPHSASGVKLGITRTGSGTSIPSRTGSVPTKTGSRSNTNSRPQLRSSEDVLKDGRRSPAATAGKVRVTSPLSTATVAPRLEKESQDEGKEKATEALEKTEEKVSEKTEAEAAEQSAEDSAKLEEASDATKVAEIAVEESEAKIAEVLEKAVETEAQIGGELKIYPGLRGFKVSRPSCRHTQVKSKIANWKKMEEEARVSGSPSPIPPSPRSPSSTFSHISPTSPKVSSHTTSDPHTAPISPPASPRATLTPRRSSEPLSSSRSRQRSESPSPNLPVKSRIAMWAEKEREAGEIRSSLSPQRSPTRSPTTSPQSSPKSTPKGLKRQSPVDKTRRSPGRSAGNSREGSVESNAQSLANSTEGSLDASPSRQLPSITIKEENVTKVENSSVKDTPTGDEYEDVEVSLKRRLLPEIPVQETASVAPSALSEEAIYSTIPDVFHEDTPPRRNLINEVTKTRSADGEMKVIDIEDENESVGVIDAEYTRPAPAYTEIEVLEDPRVVDVMSQSVGPEMTPKSKRRWLLSPRFGRRKGSTEDAHSEGAASDKEEKKSEREEKKSEGFMKKIVRIRSRSGKDKLAVNKRRSAEVRATESDTSSSPEHTLAAGPPAESRTRSSSELASDQLAPEVIPRSNSYSTSASPEVGYSLTTHQNLSSSSSSSSQRVVSSNPTLSREYGTTTEKKLDPVTQRVVSNQTGTSGEPSLGLTWSADTLLARPNDVQQRRSQVRANDGALSHELRNLIDNFGEGVFCDEYSKKVAPFPGKNVVEKGTGSAPGGLRLPVRFELTDSPNHGSSHPNLVSVGFTLPVESGGSTVANGVGVRGGEGSKDGSDSSTASEGEEQGIWEKEEGEDTVYPIESSLDTGRATRYDIKRKLSESSDKAQAVDQNTDNLVVTSLMYADAVWDRVGMESDELSFNVGDVIEILDMSEDTWWQGNVREKSGWFPSSFVRLRVAQEEDDEVYSVPPDAVQMVGGTLPRISTMPRSSHSNRRMTIRRKDSCPSLPRKLTPTEVRSKVVEEILNTERDYVKHLEDIIEGFLKKCRLNSKLFDQESVETIFSNLESLYQFQLDFLHQLEARVSPDHMEDSQIGEVFVSCRHGFEVYSEYCNNHPHAVNEMCVLQKKEQYAFFFESCRLLRNLQNIPLEGFLLLPVQRICKYPLQLSELLKYTSEDHPDRAGVEAAVGTMRQVATHINEGKRRLENIGRIGKWQEGIDGWKGPDIVETSTEMIHSSELHKISKGHSQERHFFLFDNQLIYCKKEAIGGRLSYKGRLSMDKCQIIDLPDGQETHNGLPVRNAWKMDNKTKGKDYIIFAKSSEVKSKWMDAFRREKERVAQDKASGFSVSLKMKRAAAALCSSTAAAVSAAKRRKSFNKKQVLRVTGKYIAFDVAYSSMSRRW
jgi:Rho guanine nucleotide exchange factor 4